MYANSAHLQGDRKVLVDNREPLLVSSCGTYRLKTRPQFETNRPKGRPDYQILYVASGSATFFFEGQPRRLQAGSAVLYRPGESQRYIYRAEDKPRVYWLHFTGREAAERLKLHGLWGKQSFYVGTSAQFSELFDAVIRELQLCRPLYRQLLPDLLEQLFLLLHRQLLEAPNPGRTVEGEIWEAVNYFQKHYDRPIVVADYAKTHHMSSAWFIHEFKRRTGLPPMRYILNLRLSNARALLAETDYAIGEVAAIVGFSDPLYFSRLFKKHFSLSPNEYRKASKEPEAG